jgi:hypothetical protein
LNDETYFNQYFFFSLRKSSAIQIQSPVIHSPDQLVIDARNEIQIKIGSILKDWKK